MCQSLKTILKISHSTMPCLWVLIWMSCVWMFAMFELLRSELLVYIHRKKTSKERTRPCLCFPWLCCSNMVCMCSVINWSYVDDTPVQCSMAFLLTKYAHVRRSAAFVRQSGFLLCCRTLKIYFTCSSTSRVCSNVLCGTCDDPPFSKQDTFKDKFRILIIYVMLLSQYNICTELWCDTLDGFLFWTTRPIWGQLLHIQLITTKQTMRHITADHAGDTAAQKKWFEDFIRLWQNAPSCCRVSCAVKRSCARKGVNQLAASMRSTLGADPAFSFNRCCEDATISENLRHPCEAWKGYEALSKRQT